MTYIIMRADNLPDLIAAVQERIDCGWIPQGGIASGNKLWVQAMVKPA